MSANGNTTTGYRDKLLASAGKARSIFCLGIDPILELFPEELRLTGTHCDIAGINTLVQTALDALEERRLRPAAFKPNIGYFTACDRPLALETSLTDRFAGSLALAEVLRTLRTRMPGVPIILDSKRGDIARSSANYAMEAFRGWQADAVTVSPWMGDDSVKPFLSPDRDYVTAPAAWSPPHGIYLLVRTSNPGATRFQNLSVHGRPLYRHVLEAALEWSMGAVVGATAPDELTDIVDFLRDSPIPLLIPGVGRQGGSAGEVLRILREAAYPRELVRVNVSGGALFPWAQSTDGASRTGAPTSWRGAVCEAIVTAHENLAITGETR
jgi:orotidine-5'-phosphate decarboxylase